MKRSTFSLRSLFALVLVLVMIGTMFTGCNKTGSNETVPSTSEPTTQTTPVTDPTEDPTEPDPTEEPTVPGETEPPAVLGYVNAGPLNVRSEPTTIGSDILKRLETNTRLEILEQKILDGLKWGRIADGWVNMNYVTIINDETELPSQGTSVENENNIGSGSATTPSTGSTTKPGTSTGSSSGSGTGSSGTNNTVVSNGKTVILGYGTVKGTSTLAIRTGPGTNYAMVNYLESGDVIAYYQVSGDWVRMNKGWVSSKYLELESAITAGTTGKISAYELNIRKEAKADSDSLGTLKQGTSVTILEVKNNWGKIEYATGKTGWINLNYVDFSRADSSYITGKATVTADHLNVRKEADAKSTALTTLKKNDSVSILELDGKWGKIEYATGKYGWINLDYVRMEKAYTTGVGKVTASSLNIRDKASTSGKDLGSLYKGAKITILEVDGAWGKIEYATGKYGWISLNYVEMDSTTKYKVTIATLTNGKVETSDTSFRQGTLVTLTVTPNTGYALDKLTVAGKEVTVKDGKYTFTMPAADVAVSATFKVVVPTYTVTISSAITNGKVTASSTSCKEGAQVVLTAVPNSGYVLKAGSLTVMNTTSNTPVTVTDGKFTMPAGNVNVVAEFEAAGATTYTITDKTTTGGEMKANTTSAVAGVTITLTADADEGYVVDAVPSVKDASNNPIPVSGSAGTYTFTMPASNVTVVGSFKKTTYTVNVTQPSITGCTLSVNPSSYEQGKTVEVTVGVAAGHELDKLTYTEAGKDPVTITKTSGKYTFTMPAANVTVAATFKKLDYAIAFGTMTNGSVSAKIGSSAVTSAQVGDTVTLDVKPAAGYVLDTLTYTEDGKTTPVNITGTSFTMPAAKVTINATFTASPSYTITVTAGTGGSAVAKVGSNTVTTAKANQEVTLDITANSGYELDKVTVNGTELTLQGGKYAFTMPANNTTVSVTFSPISVKYKVNNTSGTFVNIRKTADSSSEDLGDIPNGTILEAMEGSTSTWVKVTYNDGSNDIVGWVGIGNLVLVS